MDDYEDVEAIVTILSGIDLTLWTRLFVAAALIAAIAALSLTLR